MNAKIYWRVTISMLLFWSRIWLPFCNIDIDDLLFFVVVLLLLHFEDSFSTKSTLRSRTKWQGWALIQLLSHVFFYLLQFVYAFIDTWQGLVVVNLKMIMILRMLQMISSSITIMIMMIKEILLIMIMLIMTGPCQHNGDADPFCRRYWYVQGGPTLFDSSESKRFLPFHNLFLIIIIDYTCS